MFLVAWRAFLIDELCCPVMLIAVMEGEQREAAVKPGYRGVATPTGVSRCGVQGTRGRQEGDQEKEQGKGEQ